MGSDCESDAADRLLDEARKLVKLLEDRHPGLLSWNEFFWRRAESLRDELNEWLEDD